MNILESIKRGEGFRERPYKCTAGVLTIGYGFTFLTRDEADAVLEIKVRKLQARLYGRISRLSLQRQDVIIEMAYNLGLGGLFGFGRMWQAIDEGNFDQAAIEMLDSKWSSDVGNRANMLAAAMKVG